MHDRKNRTITIIIEGKDYDKYESFEEAHEDCILKYPNMTGGHFKIEAVADGFGLFKTVTCVCGESIVLDGEYEKGFDSGDSSAAKPVFQTVPEDRETEELLKMLLRMKRSPELFFGKNRKISLLKYYVFGFECAARLRNKSMGWNHIHEKLLQEYTRATNGKDYSEEELFQLYLDILERVLRCDFPEYAKRFFEEEEDPTEESI